MEILALTPRHPRWNELADFAERCAWRAGPELARRMRAGGFLPWERVFAAVSDGAFAGYCTFTAHDELPEARGLSPFIGFVFVDGRFRGQRLSQRLVERACACAASCGFERVYILSGEIGLYEKYGFQKIGEEQTLYGTTDQLFAREIPAAARLRRIRTERLLLRPLDEADAADVFEWAGDPVVNRWMPYALYDDAEQVRRWIAGLREEDCEFAFELNATGKVIGSGSIGYNPECAAYELGYNLNRAYWGRGYATEAARAMIRWAHGTLGARDFAARHAVANAASGNVIRKCGFQFEELTQCSRYDGSETYDAAFYRLHLD